MSLQYTSGPEAGSQDNGKLLLGYEDAAFMQSLQNSAAVLRSLILHATLAKTEFLARNKTNHGGCQTIVGIYNLVPRSVTARRVKRLKWLYLQNSLIQVDNLYI